MNTNIVLVLSNTDTYLVCQSMFQTVHAYTPSVMIVSVLHMDTINNPYITIYIHKGIILHTYVCNYPHIVGRISEKAVTSNRRIEDPIHKGIHIIDCSYTICIMYDSYVYRYSAPRHVRTLIK